MALTVILVQAGAGLVTRLVLVSIPGGSTAPLTPIDRAATRIAGAGHALGLPPPGRPTQGPGRPHALGEASPAGPDGASGAPAGADPPDALREAGGGWKTPLALYRAPGGGMAQRGDLHPHSELPPLRHQSPGISGRCSRTAGRDDPQPGSRTPPSPVAPRSSRRRSRGPIAGTAGRPGLARPCISNGACGFSVRRQSSRSSKPPATEEEREPALSCGRGKSACQPGVGALP